MRDACREASAVVLTGDTKVMGKGEIDGIVINTTGVGLTDRLVRDAGLRPGDRIIVTGTLGDHGMAVMATRHGLDLDADLQSDVAPLNGLICAALQAARGADDGDEGSDARRRRRARCTRWPRRAASASCSTKRRCRSAPRCAASRSWSGSIRCSSPTKARR